MIRRLAAAAVLVAVAAFLLLVARDAWHWSRAIRDADARAALGYTPPQAWDAGTALPSSWTRGLLGIDDDLQFRTVIEQALRSSTHAPSPTELKARAVLESALVRLSRTDPNERRAATAADDLGALLYFDPPSPAGAKNPYQNPGAGPANGEATPEEKALGEFVDAARLDPSNATADRNVEVLLRAAGASSKFRAPRVGRGDKSGTKGSGSRPPGNGY